MQQQTLHEKAKLVSLYDEIEYWFGTPIIEPTLASELLSKFDIAEVEISDRFDKKGIENFILDREPFLILDKAIVFSDRDKNKYALSLSSVSEQDCDGHFPGQPVIPLIHLAKVMALTGKFLSAFIKKGEEVAEVVKTAPVESLINLSTLRYATPPKKLITVAKVVSMEKKHTIIIDSYIWFLSVDWLIPAGKVSGMEYNLIPKKVFYRALQ